MAAAPAVATAAAAAALGSGGGGGAAAPLLTLPRGFSAGLDHDMDIPFDMFTGEGTPGYRYYVH